jgi:hypothetical protein
MPSAAICDHDFVVVFTPAGAVVHQEGDSVPLTSAGVVRLQALGYGL